MTKSDFFRMTVKILGLYMIFRLPFRSFLNSVSYFSMEGEFGYLLLGIGIIGLSIFILALLIHRADGVVRLLRLDKGFDDDRMELGNIGYGTLLRLACTVIGGIMIINAIPEFLTQSGLALKSAVGANLSEQPAHYFMVADNLRWAVSALELAVGYLVISNSGWLSSKLTQKQETSEDSNAGN